MRLASVFAMALLLCGCTPPPQDPNSTDMRDLRTELIAPEYNGIGFRATYPPGWKSLEKGDMIAVPETANGSDNDPTVKVQVPQLPPHIPGFIPLGSVAGGYLQDLKKRYPDQVTDENSALKIDGTDARRLVSTFQNHGKPWRDLAVLTVHSDHVYVITGDCDAGDFNNTRLAFERLLASIRWTDTK